MKTEARQLAAARSTSLRQIIEEGLRRVIETKPEKPFRLRDASVGGQGMRRKMTWDEIRMRSTRAAARDRHRH